jgi:glycosyltransferase involved in cell wall biosynthesis
MDSDGNVAQERDLTAPEGASAPELVSMEGEEITLPSFSVIIPTFGDPEGLRRTLTNLIGQTCDSYHDLPIPRDLMVVGDGYEAEAATVCQEVMKAAEGLPHVRIGYYYIPEHVGNGNMPRAAGLAKATGDWVVFCDAGTSVQRDFFFTLARAIIGSPDAKFVTWDMYQLIDPTPVLAVAKAVFQVDRSQGLPYVFPGCATAVRRDIAQLQDWPHCEASDWVYFSLLWDKLYLKKNEDGTEERTDTPEQIDLDVIAVPWTLTCCYGARTGRKWREQPTEEGVTKYGWNKGYNQARADAQEQLSARLTATDSNTNP